MTLNIAYLARLIATELTSFRDDEASDTKWFSLDALPSSLAFPGHVAPALQQARRLLNTDRPPLADRP